MNVLTIGDKRLGAALLDMGLLEDEELQRALEQHREVGGTLSEVIVEMGLLSEKRIAQAVEETFGIPLVDLVNMQIAPEVLELLPAGKARSLGAIPFAQEGGSLRVALLNPLDNLVLEEIEEITSQMIEPYQTTRSAFNYALAKNYPELRLVVPEPPSTVSDAEVLLGEILVKKGYVSRDDLEAALVQHERNGEMLGRILIQGGLKEEQLYEALAEQAGAEFRTDFSKLNIMPDVTAMLLRADALRFHAIPVQRDKKEVMVVVSDPRHRQAISNLINQPVKFILTLPSVWEGLFAKVYPEKSRLGETLVQEGKVSREALQQALSVQRRMGKTRPLGEILVELGYVKPDDVEAALQKQRQGGGRLEDTLVQSGKIKPEMLAKSLAAQLGYPYIDPAESPPDANLITMVPEATVRRYTVFPHHLENNALVVLMKDPRNILAIDDLKMLTKKDILPAVAAEGAITKLIERFFGGQGGLEELTKEFEKKGREREESEALASSTLDDNAVVRLVNNIIREAYIQDASDIHVEPRQIDIIVRLRIDGSLREYMRLPKGAGPALSSRIKIMGNLDIAERRLPQDGRVRYKDRSIDLDLRLSSLPTVYGEKIVMRLLRKATEIPEIESLGFAPAVFDRFQEVIAKPYGIFLITGPTGSGKSFTTFSILKRIATPDKNTTTVEDPVEYEIPGINQTQVNPMAGLTFARALRSFLRQDPDIIMVGEIRDAETAKIATEAALTGHLVIATLHTNDAAGAVTRLEEMGVEPFNISASLVGVLAQRLVRRVCRHCQIEIEPDPAALKRLNLTQAEAEGKTLYKGTGCERCNGSGYKGRYAIHELMVIDDEMRHAIVEGKSSTALKEISRKNGMRTLREDGIGKAFQGITTLEEVMARTNE